MSTTVPSPVHPRTLAPDRVGLISAVAIPILGAVVLAAATAAWHRRLADPIRIPGDETAASLSPWATTAVLIAVTVLVGTAIAITAAVPAVLILIRRVLLVAGSTAAGLVVGIGLALLAANRDVPAGSDPAVAWWPIGPAVLIAVALGVLAAAGLTDPRPPVTALVPPPDTLPRSDSRAPLTVTAGMSMPMLSAVTVVIVLLAAGTALIVGTVWPAALFLPLLWLIAVVGSYRTRIDAHGVRVASGGMTLFRYPLEQITAATTVETVDRGGGWGARARDGHRFGVLTGGGPAVVIHTAGGDELTVSTGRAEEAAARINALAAARFPDPAPA